MTAKQTVLAMVREVKEVADIKEAAQMLASGNWIAISATTQREPTVLCMGRLGFPPHMMGGQENTGKSLPCP